MPTAHISSFFDILSPLPHSSFPQREYLPTYGSICGAPGRGRCSGAMNHNGSECTELRKVVLDVRKFFPILRCGSWPLACGCISIRRIRLPLLLSGDQRLVLNRSLSLCFLPD